MIQLQCASYTFNTVTTRHVFNCSVKDAVQIGTGTMDVCVLFGTVAPVTWQAGHISCKVLTIYGCQQLLP